MSLPDGFTDQFEVFEGGYCHALACVLAWRTGLPVVGLYFRRADGRPGEIDHYVVQRPDGLLLDVRGARRLDEINPRYCISLPIDPDGLWSARDMEDAEDVRELAEEVADRLLLVTN